MVFCIYCMKNLALIGLASCFCAGRLCCTLKNLLGRLLGVGSGTAFKSIQAIQNLEVIPFPASRLQCRGALAFRAFKASAGGSPWK